MQICVMKYKSSGYEIEKRYKELTRKEKKVLASLSSAISVAMFNTQLYAKELNTVALETNVGSIATQLVGVAQIFIYWITLLSALIDIAKAVRKQDISGVTAIVIKYSAMMGAGYALPWLWEIIRGIFTSL